MTTMRVARRRAYNRLHRAERAAAYQRERAQRLATDKLMHAKGWRWGGWAWVPARQVAK